jgi:alkylation response protein AidB-like acyl-CoA dehydrogenase
VDLRLSPEDLAFREEFRTWLDGNLPAGWREASVGGERTGVDLDRQREWQRRLNAGGWLKLAWPKASGGRDATPVRRSIFNEEIARAGAPPMLGRLGVILAAPLVNAAGSQWQKETYLDRILDCQEIWCQGFSEPDAGSDLAGLKTRAVHRDGRWHISGQKVWSSAAHMADRSFLLARTDPTASAPHRGIGYFIVDLRQPGVEVRPIRQLNGHQEFSEIFLNDVVVEERDLVGQPTDGWRLAMMTFGFERGTAQNSYRFERAVVALADLAREIGAGSDPVVRQRIAHAKVLATVFQMNGLRALTHMEQGRPPGPEASLTKLLWSEMDRNAIQETAIAIQGMHGALAPDDHHALVSGMWQEGWMYSQAETIFAGSSEIQRNIIAERVLGLPRGR